MSRSILDETNIHPSIREKISSNHANIVSEVQSAIAANKIVIVGMKQNPFPRKARKVLDAISVPYKYLEYGSYLGEWKQRGALKMWSGWETFPMIFVKGVLIGGFTDLQKLIDSKDLAKMLA